MSWIMKRIALLFAFALVVGCSPREQKPHGDHGKEKKDPHAQLGGQGQPTLMVQSEPKSVEAGKEAVLKLMIHDAKDKMLRDFDILHEQKIHLIIVHSGLDHFAHLHPEVDNAGNIVAKHTFPVGGTYSLFADYKPKGQPQATARTEMKVAGASPAASTLTVNAPGKVEGDGLAAEVSITGAKKGAEASIQFDLHDAKGNAIDDLQPYMGERGHLVVLCADGKQYVHAHPASEKESAKQKVVFQAHFSNAGVFKGWGQFRRQDRVHVIPFVMKVD
jgi:hypothetical protein